ncbi:MAG: DUF512 domain-containing protein [Nitrospirota bacterium]
MDKNTGAEIEEIRPGSQADASGIAPGDVILSINGHKVNDTIDFMFFAGDGFLDMLVRRKDKRLSFRLQTEEGKDTGIALKPFKIKTCTNKCIFCFVGQLPKGLRRTLYIKDEDYRMSFLYGNYVTLTNLSPQDKKRIVEQRLSPIYISVHSTNNAVRKMILGNSKAVDIIKELNFFKTHKIRMHCQIVLCPGINDNKELERTIRDLYKFYPYILSIAVVPVGLTAHRKTDPRLRPLLKEDALKAIEIVNSFQKRFRKKHGDPMVYGADELFIKAGIEFPPVREYGELPQIENGVGMVPLFLSQSKSILTRKMREKAGAQTKTVPQSRPFITFTGLSFYPYLKKFTDKLKERENVNLTAVPVENNFFGKSVTVTGLLTGRDIISTFSEKIENTGILPSKKPDDPVRPVILMPDIILRTGEHILLDDISVKDISDALNVEIRVVDSTPAGLMKGIGATA